jgi:hypothetical protein
LLICSSFFSAWFSHEKVAKLRLDKVRGYICIYILTIYCNTYIKEYV